MDKIIAVDFDGTLCEHDFPSIGKPNENIINALKKEKKDGAQIILWTVRSGQYLDEAIEWCKKQGIEFDAINANISSFSDEFKSPKVLASEYWDDRAIICHNGLLEYPHPGVTGLINREQELAISIINFFENLLDQYDIDIPDKYRENEPEEAHIYGQNYYDLENSIIKLIKQYTGEKE